MHHPLMHLPAWINIRGSRNLSIQRLIRTCHAGLEEPAPHGDAGASRSAIPLKCAGFRVKPGMTKTSVNAVLTIATQSLWTRILNSFSSPESRKYPLPPQLGDVFYVTGHYYEEEMVILNKDIFTQSSAPETMAPWVNPVL